MQELKKTALYAVHLEMGARMSPFGGWDMPLHYGSQINEHHAVRQKVGLFDISHMTVIDLHGERTREFLGYLLANDVAKLQTLGKALYSCMLNPEGGVLDDLIVYFVREDWFRLVVNAGTTQKDIAWLQQQASAYAVAIKPRFDLGMIAVQGPQAAEKITSILPDDFNHATQIKPFYAVVHDDWFIARTGYTGEDGFEIITPVNEVESIWRKLVAIDTQACGLGARDTLRLEAGMHLYGQDMDDNVSPLAAGLGWTVAMQNERPFIGRDALQKQRDQGKIPRFVGLVLQGKGILRSQQKIFDGEREVGQISSGGFSPTMQHSIGMARIATDAGDALEVDIRGKRQPLVLVKPPFVRHGKIQISL